MRQRGGSHRPDALVPDTYRPGHVFWMPAGATWVNLDKPRPFVLATACGPQVTGTLIYGSTQETERQLGAACIEVTPSREGLNRNGLTSKTFLYPGTLLLIERDHLPPHVGFLGPSLDALRAALRIGLGIGQGSCLSPGAIPGSRRGRVVELHADLALDLRTPFAILLTEARYSRLKNNHIILPIIPEPGIRTSDHDLVVTSVSWLSLFPEPVKNALLPIPVVQSVWYGDDVARETEYVLDEETLAEIDRHLCAYFSLSPAEPDERG